MSDEPVPGETKPEADADAPAGAALTPEEKIAALEAELAEARDASLRALADLQNTQRRTEKQVQDARVYAIDRFAGDLLAVSDALSRAIDSVPVDQRDGDPVRTLLVGVEMTHKAMLDAFARHGLRPMGARGEPFDPNLHQAVAQIPSDVPAGAIAEVMQPGFRLNERTLRAAIVAVSLGGAAAEKQSADAGDKPDEPPEGGRVDVTV